jgi:tetratricopeptide (TPR) repeat protein
MAAVLPEQDQHYSIQFLAIPMVHKEKGLAIYEQLKAKGYFVYFIKIDVKGTDWMRLKAGLFSTVTQATEFGTRFKQQERFDFFVSNADVRVNADARGRQIITTPNALWVNDANGFRELLVYSPETIVSADALDRITTTLSPDGAHVICDIGSRQHTIRLRAAPPAKENQAPVLEGDTGDAEATYQKGLAYYKRSNLDEAAVYFDRALKHDPLLISAYYYRGIVRYRQGKYDQAIADCSKALELNPRHTEAYNIRALVWLEKGEVDRAIKDCDRVLKIDPQNIAAYSTLGVAWLKKGEVEWACSDLRKACDLGRCETLETVRKQGYCP